MAVFCRVAAGGSGSGGPGLFSEIVADVSIDSPEGGLVDRKKLDVAVTLLARSKLIEAEGDRLTLTAEGDHFWRRISHLPPSAVKRWIREAVDVYSRGEEVQWAISENAWSQAEVLFLERHRTRMTSRLEVLNGLVTALENWHFVSSLIGAAADREAAVAALQGGPFFFTKAQATQILDMRASQRTALGRLSLAEERDAIRAELEEIIGDDSSDDVDSLPRSRTPQAPDSLEETIEDLKHLADLHTSGLRGDQLSNPEAVALRQSS